MRLNRRRARQVLVVLLFLGALLRFLGIDWDAGHHLHPDERFISMVEEKLAFPKSAAEYFDSARSPMSPYNRGHDSFVYGTLPMFLTKAAAAAIGKDGYGGAHLVGRALSGLADLLSVWLAYLLARRFSRDRRVGLAAAGLLAFCPLGLQLSHFWAVDAFLAAFSTATLLGAVRLAQGRSKPAEVAATGAALGLAVACKVTALALFLPLGLGILVGAFREGLPRQTREAGIAVAKAAGRFALALAAAAIALRVGLPYAFAGPGFFSFRLDPRYLGDMKRLAELSSSVSGFPPAFQWAGRTIFFPLKNLVLWGAGPFFGLAALASLVWAAAAAMKRPRRALLPLVAHAAFLLLYHGTTTVKSIRYFYPAYPALAVLAALFLAGLGARAAGGRSLVAGAVRLAPAIAVAGTLLWGLAFTSIYRRPHPRVTAARWIYENIPPPASIGNESWDDGQPLPLPDHDAGPYAGPVLHLFDPDSAKKVEDIVRALKEADWVAVTSNRVYGNVTRVPEVFPMSRAYYRALFEGRLGFDLAADFSSYPSLGPLKFPDDRAEEQFTVYDHPRVLLFRKNKSFSPERAAQILLAAIPKTPPTLSDWEKFPRSRRIVSAPVLPPRRAELQKSASAATPELAVGSLGAAVVWYLAILLVGAAAFPLAHAFFPRLADRGAGVSRILGLVGATFLLAILVQARALPNGRGAAWLCLLFVALPSALLFWKRRDSIVAFFRQRGRLVVAGEAAFAVGFLLFLGIRSLNPEIYWGEKPMDFSILNILVRTRTLPASDPWFAGAPLGYYAFGQQMIALLTLLTGLSTRFTFNLAFGLLGGLLIQAAFTLARNWAGTLRAGVAGAGLMAILGNFAGLREWLVNHRALDWDYFWATSRVVKDTINEYPFWSLIFADLHSHVLAMPLFLLVAAAALHFVRVNSGPPARLVSRLASGAILGFAAAAQALTNAWDAPLLGGLLVLVFLVAATAESFSPARLLRLLPGVAAAAAAAWATAAPLWVRGGGSPGFGWEQEPGAKGVDVVTVFGLFFFLAFAWLLGFISDRMAHQGQDRRRRLVILALLGGLLTVLGFLSVEVFAVAGILLFLAAAGDRETLPEERLACGFLAAAFFLLLFAQRVYISDRMNTFFKLYLEAWLLFAVSTAALAFRRPDQRGAFGRWARPAKGVFILAVLAALFTTVTAARGAVSRHFAAYSGPSLDGLRYLAESRPGEYRAALWLRRSIKGTPVILEAQGDPYQDFSRISMLTGLPTVLGWEHHVKQRGNPESEVIERREAVRRIYSAREPAPVERLLRRYHVGYVYVGWLERKTYPTEGLRKFDRAKDLFELAYENREAKVYRVVGGDSEDVLTAARETLPAPEAGQEIVEEEEAPAISQTPEEGRTPFSGMKEPRDGDVDARGRLWVADFGNSRIRIFDREGGFLGGWGGRGDTTFAMKDPSAVSIRGDDVFVADTWNGRVQSFTIAGEWKSKAVELYGPRGIAAAPDGRVWVTDTGNHRIVSYDAGLGDKQVFGKLGPGPGEFSSPVGIAVGPSGSVHVADTGNHRIQVFDGAGKFLRALPVAGWEGAVEPHLEIGKDGTIYVSDPTAAAVVALDPAGAEKRRWTADDEGGKFDKPTGLALERKAGILYVVNSGNNRITTVKVAEKKP